MHTALNTNSAKRAYIGLICFILHVKFANLLILGYTTHSAMATISQNKERERVAYRIYKVEILNMAPFKDLSC